MQPEGPPEHEGAGAAWPELARELVATGRALHARGWMQATAGNFSAVAQREPLRLLVSPSGADKGRVTPPELLLVDGEGRVVAGRGRPSDETSVHLAVVRARGAGAVLHTHSVWATLLAHRHASRGGLRLRGFEMLKGLSGVTSHEHEEWLPILDNTQDYERLRDAVEQLLARDGAAHGLLLAGHGLYAWGRDLRETHRHVEALEFLLELVGRGAD